MKNNILNVGLIVDQFFVDKYIFDLINWSKNISSIKISTLIVQNKKKRKILDLIIKNSLGDIIKKTLYKLLLFIESALFNFKKKKPYMLLLF